MCSYCGTALSDAGSGYKGQALAAIVLGLSSLGLLGVGTVTGVLAIIFAVLAMGKVRAGKGMAMAGMALGGMGLFGQLGLMAILFPALGGARESARQAACQANLSAIGKGTTMYSAASDDRWVFPLIRAKGDPNDAVGSKTHDDKTPFATALGANGMQNVWLLIQDGSVGEAAFHCSSDTGWKKRTEKDKYGWTSDTQFSYGIHWPYDEDNVGTVNPAALSDPNAKPTLVMFADRSPGGPVSATRSHTNHPRHGVTIMHRDTTVRFYKARTDSLAGYDGDDIYTNSAGVAGGIPTDKKDDRGFDAGRWDSSITPAISRSAASQPASGTSPAAKREPSTKDDL